MFLYCAACALHPVENEIQFTSNFSVSPEAFRTSGRNRYFILEPGYFLVLEGREGTTSVRLVVRVLNETRVVNGVVTRVVAETEYHNGELVEVSRNFYAIDTITSSVWYFGEEVDIYEKGRVVSHEGSWLSGENGATYGLMMPGLVLVGARYYQEMAPGVAMDRAEVLSLTETVEVPAGRFTECLKVVETTPLEPAVREYKYYAPGVGLAKDGELELVEYGFEGK